MKLIIYSIICGFFGLALASVILNNAGGFGIGLFGLIGFFSPGLYVLNKLYEKSKEQTIKE